MSPISLIPAPYRAAALAAAVVMTLAAVYSAGHQHGADAVRKKWEAQTAAQAKAALAAEVAARAKENAMQQKYQAALDGALMQQQKIQDAYDAARQQYLSLRNTTAAARSSLPAAACPAIADTAHACLDVFDQCAVQLVDVAAAADAHAADAKKLSDAWPE